MPAKRKPKEVTPTKVDRSAVPRPDTYSYVVPRLVRNGEWSDLARAVDMSIGYVMHGGRVFHCNRNDKTITISKLTDDKIPVATITPRNCGRIKIARTEHDIHQAIVAVEYGGEWLLLGFLQCLPVYELCFNVKALK